MIKRFIAGILLALACFSAFAEFLCFPTPRYPGVNRADTYDTVTTPVGKDRVWWCSKPSGTPDVTTWVMQHFVVLDKHVDLVKWGASTARVLASPEPFLAAQAELDATRIVPAPGSQDEYEYRRLVHSGCLLLVTRPPDSITPPLTPAFCAAAPTPPAASAIKYASVGTGTVYSTLNGKIVKALAGRKAALGTTCDCQAKIVIGASAYCTFTGALAPTEVTTCKVTP